MFDLHKFEPHNNGIKKRRQKAAAPYAGLGLYEEKAYPGHSINK